RVSAGNQPIISPGSNPPVASLAISAPTLVDNNGQTLLPIVISGPAGAAVTYRVTDGKLSVSGSGTLSGFGRLSITVDVSTLANGVLTISATVSGPGGGTVQTTITKNTVPIAAPTITGPTYVNLANRAAVKFNMTGPKGMFGSIDASDGTYTVDASGYFDSVTGALAFTVDLTFLADGNVTVTASSMSSSGGSTASTTLTVVKDTVPPVFTVGAAPYINSANAGSWVATVTGEVGAAARFSMTDGVHTQTGSKTITPSGSWVPGITASAFNDGNVTLSVTETDVAGNPLTTALVLVKDTVAPTGSFVVAGTAINGVPATTNPNPALTLAFSARSGVATVAFSTNGGTTYGAAQPYSTAATVALGADGVYTIAVRVTSSAGNSATFMKQVRLDRAGPAITSSITAPTNAGSYDVGKAVTLTFSASDVDNVASTTAVLDGTTAVSSGVAFNTETLAPGTHTIVITSTDGLGNVATSNVTMTLHATVAGLTTAVNDGTASRQITSTATSSQLLSYLSSAQTALNANDHATAKTNLASVVTYAQGQSGGTITAAYASLLVAWANDLIARL
ncbi:MAG TPA: hypothetical protein VJX66_28625, partial [Amycolatopsis sp.]|nr:hypothetical protein [Amycolatopsis sp.]